MARAWFSSVTLAMALLVGASSVATAAAAPRASRSALLSDLLRAGWNPVPAGTAPRQAAAVSIFPFTNITPPALADTSSSAGVSWGDYDGDDDLDLCVANAYTPSHLFRNDSAAVFVDEPIAAVQNLQLAQAITWADYDNDGDLDMAIAQYGLTSQVFRNEGSDVFMPVLTDSLAAPHSTTTATWADVDRDGWVDLYLTDMGGQNRLLHNRGDGTFEDSTTPALRGNGATMSATWSDYDGDGDLDVYLVRFKQPNQLLRNDGVAGFLDVTPVALADSGSGFSALWADLNGDAWPDLVLANGGDPMRLYLNDGLGGFTDASSRLAAITGAALGLAAADVDLDGDVDLLVTRYGDSDRVLENLGTLFREKSVGSGDLAGFSTGVAFGDFDHDGDPDAYLAADGYPNELVRNDQTTGNHWLQLRLVGTVSNHTAIGAEIRLQSGGRTQVREISGGSGYGSQDATIVSFGLGQETVVDSLFIRWPNGDVQWQVNPFIDREITVVETPMVLGVDDAPLANRLVVSQISPNPSRGRTQIAFRMSRTERVRLSVIDLQGREVATIEDAIESAGPHSATWDGRDRSGRAVHPGMYLVRVSLPDDPQRMQQTIKAVIAR